MKLQGRILLFDEVNLNNDISTVYTRNLNKTSGRRGYGDWKRSKDTIISPKAYGGFIQERKGNKRR